MSRLKQASRYGSEERKARHTRADHREPAVEAFIISVGGFLGMGAKEVALAPNSFDVVPGQNGAADKLKISATKDQLRDAQNFARYEPPRPTPTTGAGGVASCTPGGADSRFEEVNILLRPRFRWYLTVWLFVPFGRYPFNIANVREAT